ncbi:MAG: phosphoribosylformylglycinamidine synthase I [Candidatus Omnitrophica bacterium]|nr:phosphoribosylformylglycinamidine synthase I [Candidatus Omnitrophota bacterium]
MNKTVKVIVLRTAGTNCDQETAFAFSHFGAQVDLVHINALLRKEIKLEDYHILAVPGGFTYGDDIESGRILANELRFHLSTDLEQFVYDKKLIIGICNGFQVLVKTGILPGKTSEDEKEISTFPPQTVSLIGNDSGKFEDRWTYLKVDGHSVWTRDLPSIAYFPVAHAEGKFVLADKKQLQVLGDNGQVAFRYCTVNGRNPFYPQNPNGSFDHIAGITDPSGRVLGLMPHPERHFLFRHHPSWTRLKKQSSYGDGAKIFANGVWYVENHLL